MSTKGTDKKETKHINQNQHHVNNQAKTVLVQKSKTAGELLPTQNPMKNVVAPNKVQTESFSTPPTNTRAIAPPKTDNPQQQNPMKNVVTPNKVQTESLSTPPTNTRAIAPPKTDNPQQQNPMKNVVATNKAQTESLLAPPANTRTIAPPKIDNPQQQNPMKNVVASNKMQTESLSAPPTNTRATVPQKTDNPQQKKGAAEKKEKRPTSISLTDKSELFGKIIEIALACETLVTDKKKINERNAILTERCKRLTEEKSALIQQLKEMETRYKAKLDEISELKSDVARRDEAIGIIKADKTESAQEYKNALAASLKTLYTDFVEIKEIGTSDDVGLAVIEIFDGVLKVLEKNGIIVGK